jgi:hypothetical protein
MRLLDLVCGKIAKWISSCVWGQQLGLIEFREARNFKRVAPNGLKKHRHFFREHEDYAHGR